MDIDEYFPYDFDESKKPETLEHCIERVNRYFGVTDCPYNIDLLKQVLDERRNLRVFLPSYFWNKRYYELLENATTKGKLNDWDQTSTIR